MARISLHSLNQVGNQVGTAFELYFNLCPGLIDSDIEADQFVVLANEKKNDKGHSAKSNPKFHALNLGHLP
jgi:hypothetical protein